MRRKDPEGILGPPSTGHLARREFQKRLERDADAREDFQRQVQEEKERRRALREVNSEFFLRFFRNCVIRFSFSSTADEIGTLCLEIEFFLVSG